MITITAVNESQLFAELSLAREVPEGTPILIEVFGVMGNVHTYVGLYDIIKMFEDLNLYVGLPAGNFAGALVVAAAVPKERRFISEHGVFNFIKLTPSNQDTYKALVVAKEAADHMFNVEVSILETYGFETPVEELYRDSVAMTTTELKKYGFRDYKELANE